MSAFEFILAIVYGLAAMALFVIVERHEAKKRREQKEAFIKKLREESEERLSHIPQGDPGVINKLRYKEWLKGQKNE